MIKINLAFSINKFYLQHLSVVIKSLLESTKDSFFNIYILNDELETNDFVILNEIFKVYNNFQIHDIKIDKQILKEIPIVADHLKIETLYRLMLAELLDESVEKIIYLDTDIIILGDIKELWFTDISNHFIAATNNITSDMYKVVGLEKVEDYFNAGVIVINLKKWRENKIINHFFEYALKYPERIIYADQDILNGCFDKKWIRIHPRWNVQTNIYSFKEESIKQLGQLKYDEASTKPGIIHFSGSNKPWDYFCDQPFYEKYFEVLESLKPYFSSEKKYIFEDEEKNIYIWGAGVAGASTLKYLNLLHLNIDGFIDNDKNKHGTVFQGYNIFNPIQINFQKSIILISSMHYEEIIVNLKENYEYIEENVFVVKPKLDIFKE